MLRTRATSRPQRDRAIRWAFLDRDGTLNVKPPAGCYIERPEALELLPGAAEAVKMLNRAGLWTAVVTNQRGIALGRMGSADLDAIHHRLQHLLRQEGAFVDAIYVCPHQIGTCSCRKPAPGLLLTAQREHPTIDFAHAAIVGDSPTDVEAGRRLGLMTVLLADADAGRAIPSEADHVVADLLQAASLLIAE